MLNSITISSTANVISRFCVQATVTLRNGNTGPATWQHDDARLDIRRGRMAVKPLEGMLEPSLPGGISSLEPSRCIYSAMLGKPASSILSRFIQPASQQLFQRIS